MSTAPSSRRSALDVDVDERALAGLESPSEAVGEARRYHNRQSRIVTVRLPASRLTTYWLPLSLERSLVVPAPDPGPAPRSRGRRGRPSRTYRRRRRCRQRSQPGQRRRRRRSTASPPRDRRSRRGRRRPCRRGGTSAREGGGVGRWDRQQHQCRTQQRRFPASQISRILAVRSPGHSCRSPGQRGSSSHVLQFWPGVMSAPFFFCPGA